MHVGSAQQFLELFCSDLAFRGRYIAIVYFFPLNFRMMPDNGRMPGYIVAVHRVVMDTTNLTAPSPRSSIVDEFKQ